MSFTLELTPDLEQRLIEAAERDGAPPPMFLNQLLEAHLPPVGNGAALLNGRTDRRGPEALVSLDAWERSLLEWIESHPRGRPLLSDAAIDRESIYGEEGCTNTGSSTRDPRTQTASGILPPPLLAR